MEQRRLGQRLRFKSPLSSMQFERLAAFEADELHASTVYSPLSLTLCVLDTTLQ